MSIPRLTKEEMEERDRKKLEMIQRKTHTKDILGMETATRSIGAIDESKEWSKQQAFKEGIQQIKDFRAGLFLLDFVDKIECSEDVGGLDTYDHWDQCTVHFRNRTQEFFDIDTILTEEHKVKKILSTEGKFKIEFKEPTAVQLYTWKGSLIDLNPHEIKRVVIDRKVPAHYRKAIAYRYQFTRKAKKGEISDK